MKIALYARKIAKTDVEFVQSVVQLLHNYHCELLLHIRLFSELSRTGLQRQLIANCAVYDELAHTQAVDFMMAIGGDGAFIDSANIVGGLEIPLMGINTGRIGFLATTHKHNFAEHVQLLLQNSYIIEERTVLHLESNANLPCKTRFALNDITVRPTDDTSINAIKVWLDDSFVNTYWGDGLIIATPTGSTAYSLSCGGPILLPSTCANIITPIASHTLAVRPIVAPTDQKITISVESRSKKFSLALDSKRILLQNKTILTITPEKFKIKTVRFPNMDFFTVIREKLMWGVDRRNSTEK